MTTRARHSSGHSRSHPGWRRPVPLLWAACAVAAGVLALGVSGTLASWTTATVTNDASSTATTGAVILREVGPDGTAAHTAQTCFSSSDPSNVATCSTINAYGGTTAPLAPGGSQVSDLTFTNVGSSPATRLVLTPGTCAQTPTAGTGTPPAANVCTNGELTVAVSCSNGATYSAGSAWNDLKYAAGAPGAMPVLTRSAGLAAGASATCRITVALTGAAGVLNQGVTMTQPVTWTLEA